MIVECFSLPKRRDLSIPSEDTLLMLPGVVGVFDGATDAMGRDINGITPGRMASEATANACAALFASEENFEIPAFDLMQHLSEVLVTETKRSGFQGRPATTMALVLYTAETFRFILNGDSGIRINGTKVLQHNKVIDTVSTIARIQLYRLNAQRHDCLDDIELATRRLIFLGLEDARGQDLISQADVDEILATVVEAFEDEVPQDEIEEFLMQGIQGQFLFANNNDKVLGYSTLNGSDPTLQDVIEVSMPASEIRSVEVFSDGYFAMPGDTSVSSWEAKHADVERRDLRKLDAFPNVKGSTTMEFSDDRCVITMNRT